MRNLRRLVTAAACALSLGAVLVVTGIEGSGQPVAGIQGSGVIEQAFPDQIGTCVADEEWVPAHADLNWANVTGPDCWVLDW
ncbi:hypothetical protein ACFQ1S_44420, partial [Kibdelosporangium lantanae]